MKPKSLWRLLKAIFIKWLEDDPFQSAAALSYYTLFSLAPLLIISIAVAGFVFGREAAQNQIVSTIQGLIGQESAQAVQSMIQNASNRPKTGMISTLLGGIILLFGAGGVVGQLQTSLNTIWGVKAQSDSGIRDFIRKRFISFAMLQHHNPRESENFAFHKEPPDINRVLLFSPLQIHSPDGAPESR